MAANRLFKTQKNEVFAFIQKAALDPAEFNWEERPSRFGLHDGVPTLVHASSSHYFKFDLSPEGHFVEFTPGKDKFVGWNHPGSWNSLIPYFCDWLSHLREELGAPNLWESIASEKRLMANVQSGKAEDIPFDNNEIKRIEKSLIEIKQYLATTQGLNERQLKIVDARLGYLEGAAQRMGRKDWIMLATGVFTNIAVTAALTPDIARELFQFAGQMLGWILDHRLFLPPLSL